MTTLAKNIIKGFVLSVVILVLLISLAVYQRRAAVRAGNEAATRQRLKTIAASEIQYFNTHSRTFGTFEQMVKEGTLTNDFLERARIIEGYLFTLKVTPKETNQESSYTLNADPKAGNWEGAGRHFYLDSTSLAIHVNPDRPASSTDPAYVPTALDP